MKKSIYAIGGRIRQRRKEFGWTQKELAQRAGTSYKYIGHVETGVKFPSLEMLILLARELDVSLDWLIGVDDVGTPMEAFLQDVMEYIRADLEKYGICLVKEDDKS